MSSRYGSPGYMVWWLHLGLEASCSTNRRPYQLIIVADPKTQMSRNASQPEVAYTRHLNLKIGRRWEHGS